ncbi:MAG: HesB/IscA family protein [Alphaproteobacteria bacterium]|nr:iron-sulfur cluster assembly accessory protein [Candidatus Jidaibacter sp.]
MDHTFKITQNAAAKIIDLVSKENSEFFRIEVEGGGCSGFQYKFDINASKQEGDLVFESHGANVLIDQQSLQFLEDSEIDYEEDLGSAGFKIKNPNSTARCGCGNSFAI